MNVIDHHIQRKIINKLMHADNLRFSELKPSNMESNIFMYHINQLKKIGYVTKNDNGYSLSTKGQKYVDSLSSENVKPRHQPKLICIIALQSGSGDWLLAKRKIQPYLGSLMFPSGMQHWGESSLDHAKRELFEKTGLNDIDLQFRGTVDIQIHDDIQELLTHAVANVYYGNIHHGDLPPENERYAFLWDDIKGKLLEYMPGTVELAELIKTQDYPFNSQLFV